MDLQTPAVVAVVALRLVRGQHIFRPLAVLAALVL
jgi:hypothetical protein